METLWIATAFACGLLFRQLGLPPLVGFLAAGFALNATGAPGGAQLEHIAHIGVLLLLFTVGMKVRLRTIARAEVLGGASLHLALWSAGLGALLLVVGFAPAGAFLLAGALGFSSTVIAAKGLEEKRELRAFHGRVAIGILIVQDLIAVALLAVAGGAAPSPWAVLVLALPLVLLALRWLLDAADHGELLVLFGLLTVLAIGGFGFASVGLSAELGALVLGAMLAQHPRAEELARALWGVKEVFLVGFFLQIGMAGLPDLRTVGIAIALNLALPLKAALFFALLLLLRLRARSSFLAAVALGSYSEFGLIVAQLAARNGMLDAQWVVTIALAVAISFALAAPASRFSHRLYARFETVLCRFERAQRHPDDQPVTLGSACFAILGMGRVGTGAYDHLTEAGYRVVGLDTDPATIEEHRAAGRRIVYADAEDPGLWHNLDLGGVHGVLLAMPDLEARMIASRELRARKYAGVVIAVVLFPAEIDLVRSAGADATLNFYELAGPSLARLALERLPEGAAAMKSAVG